MHDSMSSLTQRLAPAQTLSDPWGRPRPLGHSLAACSKELLVSHVESLCNAPVALDLDMASMMRIMKGSLWRRQVKRYYLLGTTYYVVR